MLLKHLLKKLEHSGTLLKLKFTQVDVGKDKSKKQVQTGLFLRKESINLKKKFLEF